MFIRTQRLFLRPLFPEDWPQLHAAIADERIVRMLARAPWPYGEADARAFAAQPAGPGEIVLAITLPELPGAPLIGVIGLHHAGAVLEAGFWIGRDWQGQGFASEALGAMLEIAATLGIGRIEAAHFLDNPASGAVLRRNGFAATGEVRPIACAGRGGEMVLARRYAVALTVMPALQQRVAA